MSFCSDYERAWRSDCAMAAVRSCVRANDARCRNGDVAVSDVVRRDAGAGDECGDICSTPDEAMKKKVQGRVAIEGVVEVDGRVRRYRVLQSLEESLDEASIDALQEWEFVPETLHGTPTPVVITVEMTFSLRDQGPDPGPRTPESRIRIPNPESRIPDPG